MSPRRSPKTGLSFGNWATRQAVGALVRYKKGVNLAGPGPMYSPRTAAVLGLRRQTARRTVGLKKARNAETLARNMSRIERMLAEIEKYKMRQPVILVRQPSGGLAMAKRVRKSPRRN